MLTRTRNRVEQSGYRQMPPDQPLMFPKPAWIRPVTKLCGAQKSHRHS